MMDMLQKDLGGGKMYHGVLAVWKEAGMTSHDVVFRLRKLLGMKKIGHTGTLDPQVEGVLVICLGEGTKLVEYLMDGTKEYKGEITLGYSTETEDAYGEIVERKAVKAPVSVEVIDQALKEMEGRIKQIPPYYSAVKVKGRRLYEYARKGIEVERPERDVDIMSFKRINDPIFNEQDETQYWSFDVQCGKGTYVRTLAVDLGEKLGYPAHMSKLVRLATGGFNKEDAYTLGDIKNHIENETVETIIHPIEAGVNEFKRIDLTDGMYHDVNHGKVLPEDYFGYTLKEKVALFYEDHLIAIYDKHPSKPLMIKPDKLFNHYRTIQ